MNTKKKIGLIILFLISFPIVVIYSIFNLGKLIVLEIIKFVIESANLFIEIISPKSGLASWFEKTKENIYRHVGESAGPLFVFFVVVFLLWVMEFDKKYSIFAGVSLALGKIGADRFTNFNFKLDKLE